MPQPPSTQLPHPPPIAVDTRPSSRSPSMLPRKTSTPSSSRTTPDPNRKSYSSGLSIGSTTSYNTVRTSTGSIQPRIPQSASSRLPAPKALILNVAASAGEDEEEVPPVPAIPKVYESPKDTSQATFPDKRKSSLAVDASSIDSNSTGSLSRAQANDPSSRVLRKPGDRPSVPTNVQADEESTAPSKKRTQPLRLPPITLAPLSTPTAQKIAALHDAGPTDGYSSPVPGRKLANTPSTPMTASKSSFFSGARLDKSDQGRLRSNSTVHYGRLESPADAEATSSSESIVHPASAQDGVPRSGVSPFLSSSVPKTSRFEAAMTKRSKTGSDFTPPLDTSNVEATPLPRPSGPRPPAPKPSKAPAVASKSPPSLASTDDTPTTSSMASLRRKLSMTWKRSASKASGSLPYYDDKAINSMPPPRIPASATVGHIPSGKQGSPSPSSKSSATGTYLEARRRKSSTSSLTAMIAQDRSRIESRNGVKKEPTLDAVAERSATKAHNSSVVPKPLRPTAPVTTIRPHDVWTADLDKYDLVAEEEMKKMGARRKETELAARTLDALRKRATAKERVSAQDAIRIAALNIYERGEIVDFKDVYFCGTQNAAKVVGEVQSDLPNYGYDDERGDYTIVPGDHLAYRYEIIDVLGKGSFGQVVRCIDHKTGVLVAVKIIRNKKRFHQQALIEVKILQKLREWVSAGTLQPGPRDRHRHD